MRYLNGGLKKSEGFFYLPIYDENVSYLAYPIIIKETSTIKRKWLRKRLEEEGIENRPLFGCIPTQQPAYAQFKYQYQGKLPVADYVGRNGFYIGCHHYLKKGDLDYIVEKFKELLGGII